MNKINLRLIGKTALFLVIFGFFMPIACRNNGFEIATRLIGYGNYSTVAGLLMFLLFFSALAGIVVAVLLLLKKNVHPIIDSIIVYTCVCSGFTAFFMATDSKIAIGGQYSFLSSPGIYVLAWGDDTYVKLQSGAYVIFFGLVVSLIAEIGEYLYERGNKNRQRTDDFIEYVAIKKCPFCAGEIKNKEAIFCNFCGKNILECTDSITSFHGEAEKKCDVENENVDENEKTAMEQYLSGDKSDEISEKNWLPTLLLAIFLGGFGAHRFYIGKIATGIIMLLLSFTGISFIWAIIDIIMIAIGRFTDKKRYIFEKNKVNHFGAYCKNHHFA
jgi:TM2 domain-containing membrane protein YozV